MFATSVLASCVLVHVFNKYGVFKQSLHRFDGLLQGDVR